MVKETGLPTGYVYAVIAICVLPFLLNLFGISFASPPHPLNLSSLGSVSDSEFLDQLYHALLGSFTHTILEWIGVCTAFFTGILSFVHFAIKRDVVTPIIGVALLFAGSMDAFHILAADRMIEGVVDSQALTPVTWAICRLFNVVILILGVVTVLILKPKKGRGNFKVVILAILCFGLIASTIIYIVVNSPTLPQTIFPNAVIKRPWDLIPLLLFMISGIFIFPRCYQQYPSLFSYALVVSTIPSVVAQMHMTFGSTALFDNDFNIGHCGDQGKGFGVVAQEIRKLADQSKQYSQEINSLIDEIQSSINSTVIATNEGKNTVYQGVKNAELTADTFTHVTQEINSIVQMSQEIYLIYKQQEIAIQQVIDSMNVLNQGMTQTATGISETKLGLQEVEKALFLLIDD